ncbi:MAG: hypothetical protein KatS3mg023_1636 [Armatimonadota bacterium]|nr:MAG: hypothetical protein KatS3mg023_1636 [Armatimonadota bacterium]
MSEVGSRRSVILQRLFLWFGEHHLEGNGKQGDTEKTRKRRVREVNSKFCTQQATHQKARSLCAIRQEHFPRGGESDN